MYVTGNPKTKTALKALIKSGREVTIFSPGPFPAPTDGDTSVEGPHYPQPHAWYARVRLEGGRIVKVLS